MERNVLKTLYYNLQSNVSSIPAKKTVLRLQLAYHCLIEKLFSKELESIVKESHEKLIYRVATMEIELIPRSMISYKIFSSA